MIKAVFDLFLKQDSIDPQSLTENGLSIWLTLCWSSSSLLAHPSILRKLLSAGCDVAERYEYKHQIKICWEELEEWDGWNCLFFLLEDANDPTTSKSFEALRILLAASADIFARDSTGRTIFDHLSRDDGHPFQGSYRHELWYCALEREGIDTRGYSKSHLHSTVYNRSYTPEHYRALCYLDTWDQRLDPEGFQKQIDGILEEHPWTEEEAQELSRRREEQRVEDKDDEEDDHEDEDDGDDYEEEDDGDDDNDPTGLRYHPMMDE